MTLKLHCDFLSQPSRALYILLKTAKADFEPKFVNLGKGEHLTASYAQVNRFQKVPAIDHNGFCLSESVAIMKYLSREGVVPESLFPKESRQRATVEEFLAWQHVGLRSHCEKYFIVKYLEPMLTRRKPDPEKVASSEHQLVKALEVFSTKWLGRGTSFVTGDQVTVADLLAACELEQLRMAGFDPKERFANIAVWHQKVREHFNPHYDEAHTILNKVVSKINNSSAKL